MATTGNLITVLPDTLSQDNDWEIEVTCHEDRQDEISCFTSFTLCLDEDNQCNVSFFSDDASFLDEDFDDLSTSSSIGSIESYYIEEIIEDDFSRSTHAEMETDMDSSNKTPVVIPLATKIIQKEEREWKHLLARRKHLMAHRPIRERRRGRKRPSRNATPAVLRRSVTE